MAKRYISCSYTIIVLNFAIIARMKMKLLLISLITLGLMVMPQARVHREMHGEIHLVRFTTQSYAYVSTKNAVFAPHIRGGDTSQREVPGGPDPQHHQSKPPILL